MKLLCALFLLTATARAAEPGLLQEISWSQLARDGKLKTGACIATPGEPDVLKIEHAGPGPLEAPLVGLDAPPITADFYAITGEVRYDGVEGDGFLEMWSHFPGGGAYFSRTLGETGPMAKLRGSSGWRAFSLPFNAAGAKGHPTKLEINLHLPGRGTVYLRGLKLWQGAALGGPAPSAWWSERATAWAAGVAGAVLGCLGSLLEGLAARGRARAFVLGAAKALIGLGQIAALAGLVALFLRQPYAVWYAVLLVGVLCAGIFPFRLRRYEAHYRELELRRMTAQDAA